MADLSREQKKDYAKKLFLTEKGITQKEIAHRTGVTEATVCRWIAAENWETQRVSLLMTKDEQLSMMYQQLNAANQAITNREAGSQYPTSKEADAILKLTAAIARLETETNIGEIISVGQKFLAYVRSAGDFELSKQLARLYNDFIKISIR